MTIHGGWINPVNTESNLIKHTLYNCGGYLSRMIRHPKPPTYVQPVDNSSRIDQVMSMSVYTTLPNHLYLRTLYRAVSANNFVYCWCNQVIWGGIGVPSALPSP